MTVTVSDAIELFGVDILDYLDRQAEIPVLTGPQCQGDVSICPMHLYGSKPSFGAAVPVTGSGIEVIRGGAMNNAHTLLTIADGVTWRPVAFSGEDVALGLLTVPEGAECFVAHPEHSYSGIAAGTYVIGRQQEQAEAVRMVQD